MKKTKNDHNEKRQVAQINSNCIKRYRWKRIKRHVMCCIAPIFGFILELLADLTKRMPNINTVNISQVKKYRN